MNSDELAKIIAESIARHQSRGLVDGATGMADVVIHGRVDLLAVADEVFDAVIRQAKPSGTSWAAWFICGVENRRRARRQDRLRQKLAERLENSPTPADEAIVRLRMRDIDSSTGNTR